MELNGKVDSCVRLVKIKHAAVSDQAESQCLGKGHI